MSKTRVKGGLPDFKKIDKIAMEIGISIDNDDRIRSGIKYALLISSYNGNLCVNKLNLIVKIKDQLHFL